MVLLLYRKVRKDFINPTTYLDQHIECGQNDPILLLRVLSKMQHKHTSNSNKWEKSEVIFSSISSSRSFFFLVPKKKKNAVFLCVAWKWTFISGGTTCYITPALCLWLMHNLVVSCNCYVYLGIVSNHSQATAKQQVSKGFSSVSEILKFS